MIDVNVSLSRWPFRRLPGDDPDALARKLHALGVAEAWAGSFDALLHRDLGAVNARLAKECGDRDGVLFRPFGAVNPMFPDWREDLRRCAEDLTMPGIRLHPDFHGYRFDHPEFAELLTDAAKRKLVVQVSLMMEDPRTIHPLLKDLPKVDPAPLAGVASRVPELRLVLLNAHGLIRGEALTGLLSAGNVVVDIATLEGAGGIERLIPVAGIDRIVFGSHAPFFSPEAAHAKLVESALKPEQIKAIGLENARRLMPTKEALR
jgi:predicted TIM-barrel fold metal-dependent hydrolase